MKEENILKMIIEKESWEDIIYNIVSLEGLDPWDIDLVKLTSGFINFIRSAQELDFRIPAKVVFVASILLRLKSDYLSIFEEEAEEEVLQEKPLIDLGIDPALIKLGLPMKRVPKRQITVDELISALRKALAVRERREKRRWIARTRLEAEIGEEDIAKRVEEVMGEIEQLMRELGRPRIRFREIVEEWNREEIVKHFVPLLHLEQDDKIRCEQESFFRPIWISKVSE